MSTEKSRAKKYGSSKLEGTNTFIFSVFKKSSADLWMLLVVTTSIIFIVSVDWLSASLLHQLFGPREEDLLLRPLTFLLEKEGRSVELLSMTAFSVAATVVGIFVFIWVLGFLWQRTRRTGRGHDPAASSMALTPVQKLLLSIALIFFALALGWTSAGLEQLLIVDLGNLQTHSLAFNIVVILLFLTALGFLYWIAEVSRRPLLRYWLIIALAICGALLTASQLLTNWVFPAGIILLLLSLTWGYVLFQLVWSYAIPQNFSAREKPPRQSHLITFISDQNMKRPQNSDFTTGQFEDLLRTRFEGDPRVAEAMVQAFREWLDCDSTLQESPGLSTNFAQALLNLLSEIYQCIKKVDLAVDRISLDTVIEAVREKDSAQSFPVLKRSSCLFLDLLAIHMLSKLWAISVHQDAIGPTTLSALIIGYQKLTGVRVKWLMPVISAEHNLGLIADAGDGSPSASKLQELSLVFSEARNDENVTRTGSFEAISQIAWLFEGLFRQYYQLKCRDLCFTVFLPQTKGVRDAELKSLKGFLGRAMPTLALSPSDDDRIGIDFLDYEQCSQAIVEIIRYLSRHPEDELAIDFTGGQKPTTMAAVFATTFSHATSQYVDTNEYTVYGFDMRYHDIRFLIS